MLLSVLLLACNCAQPPPEDRVPEPSPIAPTAPEPEPFTLTDAPIAGFPELRTATGQHLQLHHLDGRVSLPKIKLPPKVAEITESFVLEHEEVPNPRGADRFLTVLRAELPFPVASDEQTFRPRDMVVTIDGEEIPFARLPAPKARRSTWRINNKFMIFSHPTIPADGSIKVSYSGPVDALARHDPARCDEPGHEPRCAQDFVRTSMTLGQHTRSGLLMVAPTTIEWDVTLPETSARFEGWLAMEHAPTYRPKSDGAVAVLSVVHEGTEVEVDRQKVEGITRDYALWEADLSAWAGEAITLKLSTEPLENPIFDWVFVGSPSIWGPPQGEVRRVVVIGIDTTRPDHLSFFGYERDTTPEIDAFASSGFVFEQNWSTAPRTRPSFRSATTGRNPLDAVGAKNIGATFGERGFATAGIVANPHLQPKFSFSDGFDTWLFDGRAEARDQVDRALQWLDHNQQRDTYLFLHFMDPHMVYGAPQPFRDRFVTDPDPTLPPKVKRSDVFAWMKQGEISDQRKEHLEALHDGELAYTSSELGRLFDQLDRMPGRTLVVLHTDHGEEFWEHDGFEHNHTLYDELTRSLLVIRPRGGLARGERIQTPTSLVDIGPTLYDLFGFADAPPTDGRSLVPLMAKLDAWPDRSLPIGYLQYSHERWGVVWSGHKYILHTGTGREELYDLEADPAEQHDIATERDLEPYRNQLARSHKILVGPGWRIRLDLQGRGSPFTLQLPAPAFMAGVLDPEAIVEHRANIEWGETPKHLPEDIGEVELSEDKKTLIFEPGEFPKGIVYVMFETPQDPIGARLLVGAQAVELEQGKRGMVWKDGEQSVLLDPGTVLIPPPTEAERMGIGPGATSSDDENTKMLCELGYLQGATCDELTGGGGHDEEDG
ncbi:MAG TPA: hypothetical protein ENK18_27775 [Deltaproteobacteria bacterium]|nr:hypothetical protein [Deltaproteobacteria bacterium]